MFERNAVVTSGIELNIPDGDFLVQYVADNVDHNIRTIDGKNIFHGMGIMATITPRSTHSQTYSVIWRRKNITSEEIANIGQINIHRYKPSRDCCRFIYEDMIYTAVYDFTSNVDFLWKSSWLLKPDQLGWSGLMQFCQKGEYPGKSNIVFLPMIDLNTSDLSCIFLTINFVSRHSRKYSVVPILTFYQLVWWKAMCIVNDEPPESDLKRTVLRLGSFHTQMNLLRSIGHIMKGSGLQEVLELIYANNAVGHILSGKAVQRAIRGHFLVNTALDALLLAKEYKIPLEAETRTDQLECQSVDENNANESTETLESRYEDIDMADNDINQNEQIETLKSTLESMISDESSDNELSQSDIIKCVKEKINSLKSSVSQSRTGALWIQYIEMIDILRSFIKAERK